MNELVERVAQAIDDAEISWRSRLIRLVDGVNTYRLELGDAVMEFTDTDEISASDRLYATVNKAKREAKAAAAIAVMETWRALTEGGPA